MVLAVHNTLKSFSNHANPILNQGSDDSFLGNPMPSYPLFPPQKINGCPYLDLLYVYWDNGWAKGPLAHFIEQYMGFVDIR